MGAELSVVKKMKKDVSETSVLSDSFAITLIS